MRAVTYHRFGPPSVLQLEELPAPTLTAGTALVRVVAAGVNFADIIMRRGELPFPVPLPLIPGVEGAGVIEAVAPDVTEFRVGDRVAWAPVMGVPSAASYAEYQAVNTAQLVPLPSEVSFEQAAAVTLQGLTAHYLINDQYPISPGVTVLVHAAAGGMGLLLVQWLKHRGATVIGTVSTEAKADQALAAGADHVILYSRENFATRTLQLTGGRGADYIIDGVGGESFLHNLEAVAVRGHICLYGHAGGAPAPFSPLQLIPKSVSIAGGYMTNFLRDRAEVLRKAGEVYQALSAGWLRTEGVRSLSLAQAATAHQLLEERQSTGKLVLAV